MIYKKYIKIKSFLFSHLSIVRNLEFLHLNFGSFL